MGQHHTFGSAGGSGGVLDHRDRIQGRCKTAVRRKIFPVQGAVNLNHRRAMASKLVKERTDAAGKVWRRQKRCRRRVLY